MDFKLLIVFLISLNYCAVNVHGLNCYVCYYNAKENSFEDVCKDEQILPCNTKAQALAASRPFIGMEIPSLGLAALDMVNTKTNFACTKLDNTMDGGTMTIHSCAALPENIEPDCKEQEMLGFKGSYCTCSKDNMGSKPCNSGGYIFPTWTAIFIGMVMIVGFRRI